MTYEVGDVIYLLSKKNHKIVPARVESVTTVKKLGGTEVTHSLSIPGASPEQGIVLEKLDVDVFKDTMTLQQHMLKLVHDKVQRDIAIVTELIATTWPEVNEQLVLPDAVVPDSNASSKKKESMKIQLPDGTMANVSLPPELQ